MQCIWVCLLIAGCTIGDVIGATSSRIPEFLYDCYRNNFTVTSQPPLTLPLLIELIRKIELNNENAVNMRIIATSLLHSVIFDGVRRFRQNFDDSIALPFRATGGEFNKYQLLVDYLAAGESSQFPRDSLTTPELCFLHKMISNTVDPWERGDESSSCIHGSSMPLFLETMSEDEPISNCPIKQGNVKTKWGPISAGHVIAGVASALQQSMATFGRIEDAINKNQNKNTTDDPHTITADTNSVNNVWVATIVGDLAEVILNQASVTPEIGAVGFWNDTLLPRRFYLKSANWDMTEAEILGGIDGLIIANNVQNWYNGASRVRLSQLLDMYYSKRGIAYDRQYKAINRTVAFKKLLEGINLEEQIAGTTRLLRGIATYEVFLSDNVITQLSPIVERKFREVTENITKIYDNAEYIESKTMKAPVEIIVILGGIFDNAYTAQQMIYSLSEATQVSHYGSKLGVINGQSGNWMANVTGELFQLFTDLYQAENEWPSTMSLGRSLETIIYYYQNKTTVDCELKVTKPLGRTILILSPDARLTDIDLARSQHAIKSIKQANPEINIIFVTPPENNNRTVADLREYFLDNDHVISPPKDVKSFVDHIAEILSGIPGNVINFYCNQSQVRLEDYITPDVETSYQIRKEYIEKGHITTNFSNSNYGDLHICAISGASTKLCKDVTVNGEISFDSRDLCGAESACNLEYLVSVNNTKVMCSEDDCRYPDQVRLDITWRSSSGYVSLVLGVQYFIIIVITSSLLIS